MPAKKQIKKIEKKQTKTAQKKELKKLRNKCLKLWKIVIRRNAGNKCEYCGVDAKDEVLHCHHIESYATNKALRYEPKNGILLDATHHKFGRRSAHKSFVMMYLLMRKKRMTDLRYLIAHYRDDIEPSKDYLLKQIKKLERMLPAGGE